MDSFLIPALTTLGYSFPELLACGIALAMLWTAARPGKPRQLGLIGAGLMLACAVLAFIMAYPLFLFLQMHPNFWGLLVVQATAQTVLTLYTGVISTILSEMFPTNVRYTALSVSYGFAVAIFGGFAPYIATFLVHVTGNPLAPSFYVMAAALASGIAVLFVQERFRAPALA